MRRFGFIGIAIITIIILGFTAYTVMAADNTAPDQKVVKDSKVAPKIEKNVTTTSNATVQPRKAIATKRANTRHAINTGDYTYAVNPAEIERAMKALGYNLSPAQRKQLGQVAKFWQKLFSSKKMQASLRQIQTELAKSPEFRKLFENATSRKSLVVGKNTGRKPIAKSARATIAKRFAGKRHYATPRKLSCSHSGSRTINKRTIRNRR